MKVAVVGAGQWGINLVKNFHALGRLGAVVESFEEKRRELTERFPQTPIYSSLEELNPGTTPALAIATPAPTHYELASLALKRGFDLFVEKPLTLSSEESRALTALAEGRGRILMAGHLLLRGKRAPRSR